MEKNDIYCDIASRTNGSIYIGVVGPVRTGKSTFITKVMENLVIPNISDKLEKQIASDEMPQSSSGKTIMTTQPMFVPANAVDVTFNKTTAKIRLVDCVGYFVEGSTGNMENDKPRMVKTPWNENNMTFDEASKFGTDKVISDYSTIAVVVTTDGSFTDISRENYEKAEEDVINQIKTCNKPFVILLNTSDVKSEKTMKLCADLEEKYSAPVICKNVQNLNANDISSIFEKVLLEFPMNDFNINIPDYINVLDMDNVYIKDIVEEIKKKSENVCKMKDYYMINECFFDSENFEPMELNELNLSRGDATFNLKGKDNLFYNILSSVCEEKIYDNRSLMSFVRDYSKVKKNYCRIKEALNNAEENGYGIVLPDKCDIKVDDPVISKEGNRFGVKIKAKAPCLHIVKVDVETEVSPIVGENKQGEDIAKYLMESYSENPDNVLKTQLFGKTIFELIEEGLNTKVTKVPKNVQAKLQKTMGKIVNDNRGGILCILL